MGPGDRYVKLGPESDLQAEISGRIIWYNALAPRPEALPSISSCYVIYGNLVLAGGRGFETWPDQHLGSLNS